MKRECIIKSLCVYLNEDPSSLILDFMVSIYLFFLNKKCSCIFKDIKCCGTVNMQEFKEFSIILNYLCRIQTVPALRRQSRKLSWESMSYDTKVLTLKTAQQMLEWSWKVKKLSRTSAVYHMQQPCCWD